MFNINKSPFGGTNTTSPFFTSTPSRFGENFPKPSTPNFGEFNKPMPPNFGSTPFVTNTNAPAFNPFGSPANNQILFGQQQSNEIFGNQFGQQEKSTFNFTPKTTGFIFGQPQTNVFKPQSSTGIFPSSSFCAPSVPPGTVVKFVPVKLTDTAIIKGINQTINGRNQCITCMKEYEDKSLEELRWEDYQVNRNKGPQDLFFNSPNNSNIEPMSMESPTAPINMFPSQESNLNKNLFGYKFGTVTTSSNTPIGLFGKPIFGFGNSTKTQNTTSQNHNQNYFGTNTTLFNQQQSQQTNLNQATTSNIFNIRNTPFINTNSNPNSPQNNTLFPGLNTNTTFSFGNSPVVTSTAVIGQSTFGQNLFNTNSLFKPSINTPSNIFTNSNNNTNTYKSAFPSLVNHASNNTVFKYNPPQNIFPNHQVQQSTNPFTSNQNQNYHDQILSMSSNPYGLSDLLNNIKEIDNNIKDSTRATNPNELSTLLKTVKPDTKTKESNEKLQPVHIFRKADQSMFDGLETGESTHAQRNPKKLVLRKYSFVNNNEEVVCSDLNRIFENMNKTSCIHPPEPKIEAVTTVSTSTQVEQDIMQHPTGIILTRPEYYTVPALEELNDYINDEDGSCIVQGFTVGRLGYGNVYFPEAFDVSNLNLDELVHFCYKEVTIYPDDEKKPPRGEGLNRKAQITLDKVWPYDKKTNMLITDVDVLTEMDYADRLRRLCDRQQTKFVDYRPDTGSWVFRVDHFSKYGDQEDEDVESQEDTEEYLNSSICGDFSKCALMKSTFFDDIEDIIIPEEVCATESEIPLIEDDVLVEQNMEIDLPYMLPFKKSYFNYYKIYSDVAAFKSRSFKIGWGRNLQFLTLEKENNIFGNAIQIHEIKTFSDNVLEKCLEEHLNKQLSSSQLNFNNVRNVANFSSRLGFTLLQEQNKVCCQNNFESDIWRLCNALWGQIQQFEILDERTIRKKLLNTWLQGTIAKETVFNYNDSANKTILKYLSLYEIEAAAKYAFQQNNLNLSMLISQLPSNGTIRNYLLNQLNIWKDIPKLIDHDLLKIYLLLAGIPQLENVTFYEDMNWLQVLGCYLWYITNPEETISRGINLYDYTFPNKKRDLRFQILKYYADNKHPITNILNPSMHTVNILDYRLSWFLLQILQSLRHCEINPKTKLFVHLNFAGQLEAIKLWHWAVFVLLFLEDVNLKASLIQDVIGRNVEITNCTTEYTKKEHFLIHKLRIPAKWLENAKATLAKHLGKTQQAISYLCYAEKWLEAYNLLMELLMPNNFFSYDYEFLNKILTPLSFHKNLLPNWEEGGGLILDFARLGIEYNRSSLKEDNGCTFRSESIRFRSSVVNIHARIRDISDLSYIRHVCAAGIAGRSWSVLDHLFN